MAFPTITVLQAILSAISAIDFAPLDQPTIRHHRFRHLTEEERPGICLRWDGDKPHEDDVENGYLSLGEMRVVCNVSIEIDADIDDEADDPTGFKDITRYVEKVLSALRDPLNPHSVWDHVQYVGLGPDEDSMSDEGRLVLSLDVIYRVRSDDPSVLLSPGEN